MGVHIMGGGVVSSRIPELDFNYPKTIQDCIYWYTGLGWWFNKCVYEWYVPTLLVFYLLSPLFYRFNVLSLISCIIIVASCCSIFKMPEQVEYLHMSIGRLPIYMLGFLYYKIEKKQQLKIFYILTISAFVLSMILYSYTSTYTKFACICPTLCLILCRPLRWRFVGTFFSALGAISLEFYLIHIYRRPQYLCSLLISDPTMQVVAAFILCFIVAYGLHEVAKGIAKKCK